ncbi:MAG: PD-(D/E)XK nuclease family protein [Clostridia bacterium]|nr:PD-(D/E)XK nuclease family protein [Clostridia bacterium]
MINFIFGKAGSGKTSRIFDMISEDIAAQRSVFLIVPEQEAVQAERKSLERLSPSAQLRLEVLNFSRLSNRVFRELGGLSYNYATTPIKNLIMWQNLRELAPLLKIYGRTAQSDAALSDIMLSAIGELKASGISPAQLERAFERSEKGTPFSDRLSDLSLIYAAYQNKISESYNDSSDDLSKLCDVLSKNSFFKGYSVYIDSFSSFTAIEHKVIKHLFADADKVVISVPLPSPDHSDMSTMSVEDSLRRLMRSADECGKRPTVTVLDASYRFCSDALAFLSDNIWSSSLSGIKDTAPEADGAIVMEICDNAYAEAEAVAAWICKLLRDGARCRDIAVVMRDADFYRGIIEPALEKADIPFFFSEKTDILSLPPVKFLLSALQIRIYGYRGEDVISHVKTGLCDVSLRDADLFEEYVGTWSISGNGFKEREWTMNPDGFSATMSDRAKDILARANAARSAVLDPLFSLFDKLEAAQDVSDMCRITFEYTKEIGLGKRISALAQKELAFGNKKRAEEYLSLIKIIPQTLADIAQVSEGEEASVEEFFAILKTVFSKTEIGSIPTSVDEVTVGSASMMRAAEPKFVFVLGLTEGSFPAPVIDGGVFSDADKNALMDLGVEISSNCDMRSSDELMYIKRVFSMPSEKLFLFTSLVNFEGKDLTPSLPFTRVKKMFGITPHRYQADDLHYLSASPKAAAAHLRSLSGSSDGEALKIALAEQIPLIDKLSIGKVSSTECDIDRKIVKNRLGNTLYLSPSKLNTYLSCPFKYYTKYVLGLREKKSGSFRASDIGTFIHDILENMIAVAIPSDPSAPMLSNDEIIRLTERTVREYIETICPPGYQRTGRMAHLYEKLHRLSLLMIRNLVNEFSDSDFRPTFFELNINGKDENPQPIILKTDDGDRIVISGIVDRVDVWKHNGHVYVRVVDYKNKAQHFSLDSVRQGFNIQMLIYLFALCRAPGAKFIRSAGISDGETLIPASVVYLSSGISAVSLADYSDEETISALAEKQILREGVILNEPEVIDAVSRSHDKSLLLGASAKKGEELSGASLIGKEELDVLCTEIEDTIKAIGEEIFAGRASALPVQNGANDPCKYCDMLPVCRKMNF